MAFAATRATAAQPAQNREFGWAFFGIDVGRVDHAASPVPFPHATFALTKKEDILPLRPDVAQCSQKKLKICDGTTERGRIMVDHGG